MIGAATISTEIPSSPPIKDIIVERPMAVNGQVVIRPMMYLALSYDHRVIDGSESVGTLVAIKEALENPEEVLMGGNVERALEL